MLTETLNKDESKLDPENHEGRNSIFSSQEKTS